ncbi:hypothetical protein [Streptomyces sp. NPDC046805]
MCSDRVRLAHLTRLALAPSAGGGTRAAMDVKWLTNGVNVV